MTIVAAFLWQKSPKQSISILMYDTSNLTIYIKPTKFIFSKKLFSFKKEVKLVIKKFLNELIHLANTKNKIYIEYKIVFLTNNFFWMIPSSQSRIVYNLFFRSIKKAQEDHPNLILKPQLRRKLNGKHLRQFKRELRKMELVSRKRTTGFEYHLWALALHATRRTYQQKLNNLRKKLIDHYWLKIPLQT